MSDRPKLSDGSKNPYYTGSLTLGEKIFMVVFSPILIIMFPFMLLYQKGEFKRIMKYGDEYDE